MQTRLRTGVISRKNYGAMTVSNMSRLSLLVQDDIVSKGYTAVLSIVDINEPTSFKAAVSQSHWREATTEEFTTLQKQGTWELVHPPANMNVIGSK